MIKMHQTFKISILLLFVIISAIPLSFAYTIEQATVMDSITDSFSTFETVDITLKNNTQDMFTLDLPLGTSHVQLDGTTVREQGNRVTFPLNCRECRFQLAFIIDELVEHEESGGLSFYRALTFPKNPQLLNYTVQLPSNYFIAGTPDSGGLSIIPNPTMVKTEGVVASVLWSEINPELPKIYHLSFQSYDQMENQNFDLFGEFSEWTVWVAVVLSIIGGIFIGIAGHHYFNRKTRIINCVPSSLLSPDEKTVLRLLIESKDLMNQKEVGKRLNWSKSKVSAIMSNLEYKEIVKREKFGRNYKIEVIKRLSD